jgi:hypothetical protein
MKVVVHRANFMQDAFRKIVHPPNADKVHKSAQKAPGNYPLKPYASTV